MKKTNELLKRLKDLGYDSMEEFGITLDMTIQEAFERIK